MCIPWIKNAQVDLLSRLATFGYANIPKFDYLETLEKPSIKKELALVLQASSKSCWMDSIIHFLQEGVLPEDKANAKKLRCWSTLFMVLDGKLYK